MFGYRLIYIAHFNNVLFIILFCVCACYVYEIWLSNDLNRWNDQSDDLRIVSTCQKDVDLLMVDFRLEQEEIRTYANCCSRSLPSIYLTCAFRYKIFWKVLFNNSCLFATIVLGKKVHPGQSSLRVAHLCDVYLYHISFRVSWIHFITYSGVWKQ